MVASVTYVHSHMSAAGCDQGCFDLEADHSIYAGGTSCPSAKKPRQWRCGCSFACLAPGSRGNHLEVSMALEETGWRIGNSCQAQWQKCRLTQCSAATGMSTGKPLITHWGAVECDLFSDVGPSPPLSFSCLEILFLLIKLSEVLSLKNKKKVRVHACLHACTWAHAYHCIHVGSDGSFSGISCLLSLCGTWGLNSSPQVCQQVLLPAEPSCIPRSAFL